MPASSYTSIVAAAAASQFWCIRCSLYGGKLPPLSRIYIPWSVFVGTRIYYCTSILVATARDKWMFSWPGEKIACVSYIPKCRYVHNAWVSMRASMAVCMYVQRLMQIYVLWVHRNNDDCCGVITSSCGQQFTWRRDQNGTKLTLFVDKRSNLFTGNRDNEYCTEIVASNAIG